MKNSNLAESDTNYNTPILLLIFNRPDTTKAVFEKIRLVKPKQLFIAADGARHDGEVEKCNEARKIVEQVDWDCELHTLFRDENMGCRIGVSIAIDWFFENVSQGIILEDDILPSDSFFTFCEAMLEKYKDNERVMHIAGESPLDYKVGDASYYFATVQHCWGWASWRRAWKHYDVTLKSVSLQSIKKLVRNRYIDFNVRDYWKRWLFRIDNVNTWDYQWTYKIMSLDGVCINPNVNLISNIGFRTDSTHTTDANNKNANRVTASITEITHPNKIECDKKADLDISLDRFNIMPFSLSHNIKREILRIIKQIRNLFSNSK